MREFCFGKALWPRQDSNVFCKKYWLIAAALFGAQATAAERPADIVDPDIAILDPTYSDPVFFWRITSVPENIYEPDPYFYWPESVIKGKPESFLPDRGAKEPSIPDSSLEKMASWAEERKSNALIVIHRGVVQTEKYWKEGFSESLVNGRAITRSVTPMILGFAVADGALALDDPISRFIPEWADDKRGEITVRNLAENSSGLEVAPQLPLDQIYGNKDLCLVYCGDVVRAALNYDYVHPPGSRFEVAQENMQILAIVIERAMKTPIQEILSERVWKKIGASDATFQLDRPGGIARVMCCMRAKIRDWARLGVLIAQNGVWNGQQVLPKGWVETMVTPSTQNPNFGLGIWLGSPYVKMRTYFEGTPGVIPQAEPFLADDVRIMEGGGFKVIHMVPSEELIIIRHGPFVDNWDGSFLVNTALRGYRQSIEEQAN